MASDRLTGLDTSFLHLEDGTAHMHVASVMVFEGPPPPYDELLEAFERRLALVPRYRQRLAFVPLGQGRPKWVDDPHLNLRYHVRSTALPSPGSEDQLRALAGRVFAQQLDRDKPLWEVWLVEGLEDDRFAVLSKTHHSLVDGISGVDIMSVLFDTSPVPAAPTAAGDRWLPRPLPSSAQLLGEALVERATVPGELTRTLRAIVRGPRRHPGGRARRGGRAWARWRGRGSIRRPRAPTTSRSAPIAASPGCRADLNDMKAIKDELGGHGQRRGAGHGGRGPGQAPAPPRPEHRRPRAQGHGAGERARRRRARRRWATSVAAMMAPAARCGARSRSRVSTS